MATNMKLIIKEELKQLHCSILLDDVREKVRKLKTYGISEDEIDVALHREEYFPQLEISEDFEIIISDVEKKTVRMEPLIKAVYLLFLLHPEGIVLKRHFDYKNELTGIYKSVLKKEIIERQKKSIEDVVNPICNSINEKCARIRKVFLSALPPHIARYYIIYGKRGEVKKVLLPRESVVWKCKLLNPQGLL